MARRASDRTLNQMIFFFQGLPNECLIIGASNGPTQAQVIGAFFNSEDSNGLSTYP